MKGKPKHLNSKADYLYIKENFEADYWKPEFQALLDSRFGWFFVEELPDAGSGVTDETHKVVTSQDADGNETYAQYELRENPTAKIFRIGFTVEEVEKILKGA